MVNTKISYFQIYPGSRLPELDAFRPFKALVVVDMQVSDDRQNEISRWLVQSGCLYMMAWGIECTTWDDSVDWANIKEFDYKEIPDEKCVMTTWHEDEPLSDVFEFALMSAQHPIFDLKNILVLHISDINKETEFIALYKSVFRELKH